ncbi:MAG: 3-oxoadipyl-CoA thiolase [Emcibacteraceae bacterium]|nr:3-oxoadipyl-CoA thiolase [Emcibacteraceae bacterium]MDG1997247.1 3-oxoadipyl-CoA thiolase [Emcibacteraceae bacterium]
MRNVFICDAIRTPVGRYGGGLAAVRADDLGAVPISALMERNKNVDWADVDDLTYGCANQAGEDNRNVGRMSGLLAGLPIEVAASTVNRLCGSGLNAVGIAANAIAVGEGDLMIAGGVESMSRAPFVMGKSEGPYGRNQKMYDTTMGWRFINKKLDKMYGTDVMPQTAEHLAEEHNISREDQDQFSFWSQNKAAAAIEAGYTADEICAVTVPQRRKDPIIVNADEHPRASTLEKMASLRTIFEGGTITAANASGINDGAGATLIASEEAANKHGLTPRARVLGMSVAGVPPRTMGIGPVPASQKLLARLGLTLDDMDILELNEAFAAQVLACTRTLGLEDNDPRINPQGGAIAFGHPLGMSGIRLITTAVNQLERSGGKYALCTMCIGVGQGIAMVIERV